MQRGGLALLYLVHYRRQRYFVVALGYGDALTNLFRQINWKVKFFLRFDAAT